MFSEIGHISFSLSVLSKFWPPASLFALISCSCELVLSWIGILMPTTANNCKSIGPNLGESWKYKWNAIIYILTGWVKKHILDSCVSIRDIGQQLVVNFRNFDTSYRRKQIQQFNIYDKRSPIKHNRHWKRSWCMYSIKPYVENASSPSGVKSKPTVRLYKKKYHFLQKYCTKTNIVSCTGSISFRVCLPDLGTADDWTYWHFRKNSEAGNKIYFELAVLDRRRL
jgi:hypothetical protein